MTDATFVYDEGTKFFTLPSGDKVPVVDGRIETQIVIDLDAAVDHDLEGFLDLISEMVTDTCLLSDFTYRPVSVTPEGSIVLHVEGDVSMIEEWDADEREADNEGS